MTGADTAVANVNTEKSACNPLEQFVLLAKTAKGAAALELIKQAIETPGVHVFGELLDMPNIRELENGPHAEYWNTLNLFAYGTYKEYLLNKSKILELTPVQKKKLQHLTIVTLATQSKCIPYSVLLEELDIKNVRDLEDLIIEAVYADIIHGKLDQKNSQLEVDYAGLGRDVRPGDTGAVAKTLANWGKACSTILECIEQQVAQANSEKQQATYHKEKLLNEVSFFLINIFLNCIKLLCHNFCLPNCQTIATLKHYKILVLDCSHQKNSYGSIVNWWSSGS